MPPTAVWMLSLVTGQLVSPKSTESFFPAVEEDDRAIKPIQLANNPHISIMKISIITSSAFLLGARTVFANNAIPGSAFTDNNGLGAAQAAAPMWYMASGTCMPSAAEDGNGHQTNGVDTDNCNIGKLNNGCPPQPQYQGTNTFYGNVAGEPFGTIPTYWAVKNCGGSWKIIYYVYFKKDTGHKSDWEGIVISFKNNGGDNWIRDAVAMEQGTFTARIISRNYELTLALLNRRKPQMDWLG